MNGLASGQLLPASVLLRTAALLIDAAILSVTTLALLALLGDTRLERRESYAALVIVVALYQIGFLVAVSATPGKIAMGLYVGDRQGHRLRPDTAILRYLALFIGGTLFGIGTTISVALVLVDRRWRRALHDRIAGTLVLSGRPPQT
jgi:uncharacterized RDD family membrane protein YckC